MFELPRGRRNALAGKQRGRPAGAVVAACRLVRREPQMRTESADSGKCERERGGHEGERGARRHAARRNRRNHRSRRVFENCERRKGRCGRVTDGRRIRVRGCGAEGPHQTRGREAQRYEETPHGGKSTERAFADLAPSAGFEPAHTPPEGDALSPELRGQGEAIVAGIPTGSDCLGRSRLRRRFKRIEGGAGGRVDEARTRRESVVQW